MEQALLIGPFALGNVGIRFEKGESTRTPSGNAIDVVQAEACAVANASAQNLTRPRSSRSSTACPPAYAVPSERSRRQAASSRLDSLVVRLCAAGRSRHRRLHYVA